MPINWNAIPDVVVPQGTFVGWGKIGQTVTGIVRAYSATDGTDFNDNPCPLLTVELTEPADNYRDKGTTREQLAAGELVTITAGQANLRRHLTALTPVVGDAIRVAYDEDYSTGKGTGKSFTVKCVRGAGLEHVAEGAASKRATAAVTDEEPF